MAYRISVFGRVQGVGFRYFVLRNAQALDVKGFVKNQPDGSVLCEAEGEQIVLEQFADLCRQGTARAIVTDYTIDVTPECGYNDFKIR